MLKGDILFKDDCIAVYVKTAGEDSEKLSQEKEFSGMGPLYRLDVPVSGIIVMSKVPCEITSKSYMAFVAGNFEEPSGTMRDLLFHDKRNNKTYPVKRLRKGVKEAVLNYRVVFEDEEKSLLELNLETGRTHQIRVQCASRKHPVLGDGKYGSKFKCPLSLQAHRICLIHPKTKEEMHFTAPLPDIFPWNSFIPE